MLGCGLWGCGERCRSEIEVEQDERQGGKSNELGSREINLLNLGSEEELPSPGVTCSTRGVGRLFQSPTN